MRAESAIRLLRVAHDARLVDVLAGQADVSGGCFNVPVWNFEISSAAVTCDLVPIDGRVVLVGQPPLGSGLDLQRVGLHAIGGCGRPWSYAALIAFKRRERETEAARVMADEQLILNIMQQAYEAPKIALGPLDWRPDRQKVRYLRMPIACDCAGFDLMGVSITATAWADEPDERVGFQLHIDINGNDYRIARVDWRPRQPHTNKLGPPDLRGTSPYTSIHDFPENAALGLEVMQNKNLPVAKLIDPEPPDFNALLLYIGGTLKIENAREIPEPPWAPVLHI